MNNRFRLSLSVLAAMLVLMIPVALQAQEITSSIRVTVYDGQGNPLPGITVTTTDTRTGSAKTGLSNDSGIVFLRGLPVGGPYTVQTTSSGYGPQ